MHHVTFSSLDSGATLPYWNKCAWIQTPITMLAINSLLSELSTSLALLLGGGGGWLKYLQFSRLVSSSFNSLTVIL